MIVYHEIDSASLEGVLTDGLRRTSRGDKGDDDLIYTTDHYLDERRPAALRTAQVSRDDNTYGFLVTGDDMVVMITDGALVKRQKFINQSQQTVLQLTIDSERCYISNLDDYDALKTAIATQASSDRLESLASSYWQKVVRLDRYHPTDTERVEVMITYDIPSDAIQVVQ